MYACMFFFFFLLFTLYFFFFIYLCIFIFIFSQLCCGEKNKQSIVICVTDTSTNRLLFFLSMSETHVDLNGTRNVWGISLWHPSKSIRIPSQRHACQFWWDFITRTSYDAFASYGLWRDRMCQVRAEYQTPRDKGSVRYERRLWQRESFVNNAVRGLRVLMSRVGNKCLEVWENLQV